MQSNPDVKSESMALRTETKATTQNKPNRHQAAAKIQSMARQKEAKNVVSKKKAERESATKIQSIARRNEAKKRVSHLKDQNVSEGLQNNSAIKIQSIARQREAKKKVNDLAQKRDSAVKIQSMARRSHAKRKVQAIREERASGFSRHCSNENISTVEEPEEVNDEYEEEFDQEYESNEEFESSQVGDSGRLVKRSDSSDGGTSRSITEAHRGDSDASGAHDELRDRDNICDDAGNAQGIDAISVSSDELVSVAKHSENTETWNQCETPKLPPSKAAIKR